MMARPNLLDGEDLPEKPKQKRSIEKQKRLKEAGLAVFGEKGYGATSIEELARRADLAVGGVYLHFRSKRQLLLVLMDDLVEGLSQLDLKPKPMTDVRSTIAELLARAFSHDLKYLGAYRAWQEAVLSDPGLARKNLEIHQWTTARVYALFERLQKLPNARPGVDVHSLAQAMDTFFWSLLAQALALPKSELAKRTDAAAHLIYHALFKDR